MLRSGSIKSPMFTLRFEMYGNGWLESTDCGVSIGKRLSRKYLSSLLLVLWRSAILYGFDRDPRLGERREHRFAADTRPAVFSIGRSRLRSREAARRPSSRPAKPPPTPSSICSLKPGDADHEELVEIRRKYRQELQPFEHRQIGRIASSSTRRLNSSQLSSRLNKRRAFERSIRARFVRGGFVRCG